MIIYDEIVDSVRERLFQAFTYGAQLTAAKAPVDSNEPVAPATVTPPRPCQDIDWDALKAACLAEGDYDLTHDQDGSHNPNKKKMIETVLDNVIKNHQILNKSVRINTTSSPVKLILSLTRRVMAGLVANEIIGVQPMTGPVAQVHTLRTRYYQDPALTLIWNNLIADFSIDVSTDNIKEVAAKLIAKLEQIQETGIETKQEKLTIQILREVVEAKSRKLQARYTFEAAQDDQAINGVLENEIITAISCEIMGEIDQEILRHLRSVASSVETIDMAGNGSALAITIHRQANAICDRSRRGPGNWCVVSETALSILQESAESSDFEYTWKKMTAKHAIHFVGTLNKTIRVYVDPMARADTPVLVGYKGTDIDAAAYYCPYIPVASAGFVIDPNNFQPVIAFLTRYGFHTLTSTPTSLGDVTNYLGLININTDAATTTPV